MAKKRKVRKRDKKEKKSTISTKKYTKYSIEGDTIKRAKTCPKCGAGVFMAEHKERYHCGKCGYTEFKK